MSDAAGHAVQMRWRDLDGLGHVNHTVVLTYLEEGRDAFLKDHGIARDEYVVGRCSISFNGEIDPGQASVTVSCGLRGLGRKSLKTEERIVDANGRSAADPAPHPSSRTIGAQGVSCHSANRSAVQS